MSAGVDVRVVIVHPGGRELLADCLRSLHRVGGVEWDAVVVANACREELPESAETSDRVLVVRCDRALGFSAANNLGARRGEEERGPCRHLLFLNNDTVVEPDAMALLVADLDAAADRAIAGPRLMIWRSPGYVNSLGLNVTTTGEAWDESIGARLDEVECPRSAHPALAVTGAALMIGSATFRDLGGWEELYGFYFEDIDLCLRARSHGLEVRVVPAAVVHHAISASAVRGSDLKVQLSWRNRFLLLASRWPWALLLRVAPRLALSQIRLLARRLGRGAKHDATLQIRAWGGALRRLPAALAARRRSGRQSSWARELAPHGSVPEISLPEPSEQPY